jgi:hypothetical protein
MNLKTHGKWKELACFQKLHDCWNKDTHRNYFPGDKVRHQSVRIHTVCYWISLTTSSQALVNIQFPTSIYKVWLCQLHLTCFCPPTCSHVWNMLELDHNKKFWEELIEYPHWYDMDRIEIVVSNYSSIVACIRCCGNVFTEPLSSNNMGYTYRHRLIGGIYEVHHWDWLRCHDIPRFTKVGWGVQKLIVWDTNTQHEDRGKAG